jgi:hypothetical protein
VTAHRCDEDCVCPADGKPLLYAPARNEHACQDPDCEHAHGVDPPDPLAQYVERRRRLNVMESVGVEELGPRMAEPRKLTGRTVTTGSLKRP